MADDEPTNSGGVSADVSILPAASSVSDDEEVNEEDGVYSRVSVDEEFGCSDEETGGVSLEEEVERTEDDLEGARVARDAEMRKEAAVTFTEYRNYNRIQLTLPSLQDNRDNRQPPFFSLQEVLQ